MYLTISFFNEKYHDNDDDDDGDDGNDGDHGLLNKNEDNGGTINDNDSDGEGENNYAKQDSQGMCNVR